MSKGDMRRAIDAERARIESGTPTEAERHRASILEESRRHEQWQEYARRYSSAEGIPIDDADFLADDVQMLLRGFIDSINASDFRPINPLKLNKITNNGDRLATLKKDKSHRVWRLPLVSYYDLPPSRYFENTPATIEHLDVFGDGCIREHPHDDTFTVVVPGYTETGNPLPYEDNSIGHLPTVAIATLKGSMAKVLVGQGIDWIE